MAEVAGLVNGGISLAAIFDQCISIFKYVDASRQCGSDFQDAALMLTLIGGRLNRWERTIRGNSELQATEEDGESADLWLKQIHRRLEEAEKLGQRYTVKTTAGPTETSNIAEKMQARVLRRNGLSLRRKARWALVDQEKMQGLISKLDMLVGSLEKLFPSLQTSRTEMLSHDVAGLLEPAMTEVSPQAIEALQAAAAKVDKDFEAIVSSPSSHLYRNIENTETSVNMGDYVSADFAGAPGTALPGGNHTYNDVRNTKSVVNMGNMYGGKSIFELGRNE